MKKQKKNLAFFLLIFFILAGCDQIAPKIKVRDNYWGKEYLQPDRVSTSIKRDINGNPVLLGK